MTSPQKMQPAASSGCSLPTVGAGEPGLPVGKALPGESSSGPRIPRKSGLRRCRRVPGARVPAGPRAASPQCPCQLQEPPLAAEPWVAGPGQSTGGCCRHPPLLALLQGRARGCRSAQSPEQPGAVPCARSPECHGQGCAEPEQMVPRSLRHCQRWQGTPAG